MEFRSFKNKTVGNFKGDEAKYPYTYRAILSYFIVIYKACHEQDWLKVENLKCLINYI